MFIIDSPAAMARALDQPLPRDLRNLLVTRLAQLQEAPEATRFIVVGRNDSLTDVEAAIGMALLLIDGADEGPTWEWAERHGSIIEVAFILGDAADVLLVPERDSTNAELLALIYRHAAGDLERGTAAAR